MAKDNNEPSNGILYNLLSTHREETNAAMAEISRDIKEVMSNMINIANKVGALEKSEINQDKTITSITEKQDAMEKQMEGLITLVEKTISFVKGSLWTISIVGTLILGIVILSAKLFLDNYIQKSNLDAKTEINDGITDALSKFEFYQSNK